jgi:chaperone modulatory protein CbpM
MSDELEALLLERAALTLEELAAGCHAEVEWVVARVQAAVLHDNPPPDPALWSFSGRDLLRLRRICALERDFDANPELAALVADLVEELDRLRVRLRRAGLAAD